MARSDSRARDPEANQQALHLDKRQFLLSLAAATAACTLRPATVGATDYTEYTDKRDNFSIVLPKGWNLDEPSQGASQGSGPTAVHRSLTWVDESNPANSVTAKISNIGADFTNLGSLGSAEQFGTNLVSSIDQSFLKRAPKWAQPKGVDLQEASLVRAREGDKKYFIEYTVKRNDADQRHLLSAVAFGYNGRFTRLFTVTAQCPEEAFSQEKGMLQQILDSFTPPSVNY